MSERFSRYDCALWGTGWASGPACARCVRREQRENGRFGLLWVLYYRIQAATTWKNCC